MEQQEEKFMKDSKGRLCPIESIKPIDIERNALVEFVINDAEGLQSIIREWQRRTVDNIRAFVELSAEQYSVKWGGQKGNITLLSYDGEKKIFLAVTDYIDLDERIEIAKQLIDECIEEWSQGSRPEIVTIVSHAFNTENGKLNVKRILELRKYNITDNRWKRAMDAISESVVVSSTKQYIRLYKRDKLTGKFEPISLDGANI